MALFKYLSKLLNKCHEPYLQPLPSSSPSSSCASSRSASPVRTKTVKKLKSAKTIGSSNLITTATIINQQRVSRVIESYSCLTRHPQSLVHNRDKPSVVTIHHKTSETRHQHASRNNNKLTPIAESSAFVTDYSSMVDVDYSLCNSCEKNYDLICKRFCKCCGKDLFKKKKKKRKQIVRQQQVVSSNNNKSTQFSNQHRLVSSRYQKSLFYSSEYSNNSKSNHLNYSKLRCNIFAADTVDSNAVVNYKSSATRHVERLRKSKAASNIKQIEYNSFLTSKFTFIFQ
jgi:hypothetical protein